MFNEFLTIPSNGLDWLIVFGYIAFLTFIIWRVFTSK